MNKYISIFYKLIVLITFLAGGCGTPDEPGERESLSTHGNIYKHHAIFHDDGQCLAMAPVENPEQFIIEYIDRELSDVPVTTFCILAATPDLTLFDSKKGEVITERFNFEKESYRSIKTLRDHGTDILKLVTQHLKPKGIEILAAIRMGDTHHKNLDPATYLAPQFAIDHPEFVIKQPDGRTTETALDYSHPEVRGHRLDIMREAAECYDIDGLELNFCRWKKTFPYRTGT